MPSNSLSDEDPRVQVQTLDVELESINLSFVEAHPGHERAFNDWYENDHFYAGGVLGPAVLAGRRWFAPRESREARVWSEDCPFPDPQLGTNLAMYFFTVPDGANRFREWVIPQLAELRSAGRMFAERTPLSIGFWDFDGVLELPGTTSIPPHVALDHPFQGLVVVFARGADPARAVIDPVLRVPQGSLVLTGTWRAEAPVVAQPDLRPLAPVAVALVFLRDSPAHTREATQAIADAVGSAVGGSAFWGGGFEPIVPGEDSHLARIR